MSEASNPYGDGKAADRIVRALEQCCSAARRPPRSGLDTAVPRSPGPAGFDLPAPALSADLDSPELETVGEYGAE